MGLIHDYYCYSPYCSQVRAAGGDFIYVKHTDNKNLNDNSIPFAGKDLIIVVCYLVVASTLLRVPIWITGSVVGTQAALFPAFGLPNTCAPFFVGKGRALSSEDSRKSAVVVVVNRGMRSSGASSVVTASPAEHWHTEAAVCRPGL